MNTSIFGTNKLVAAVRLEGTLMGPDEEPVQEALGRVRALRDSGDYFVVIVTPLAHTDTGLKHALRWLQVNDAAYDELWAGPGIPPSDEWYDNQAVQL